MDVLIAFIQMHKQFLLVGLVFIYLVIAVVSIMKMKRRKDEEDFIKAEVEVLTYKSDIKEKISMLSFEKYIYSKLKIEDKKGMIWLFRIGAIAVLTFLGFTLHLLAIFFAFEIIMILWVQIKDQEIEDEIGVSRTERINKFLDFYIPSVSAGTSVRQTMQNYIASFGDKDIIEWFYSTEADKLIPREWEEVINIYENGIASEDAGLPDKAPIYQEEMDRLMQYFNNYKQKLGEIKPICWCYYIGIPVICIMSYNNLPEVWSTFLGFVLVAILCILFAAFSLFAQKAKKDCTEKIF